MRKRGLIAHQSGEGYTSITKRFLLHPSSVRQIIYKRRALNMTATLQRSGRPSKPSLSSTRNIINQIKANPHITSRELQNLSSSIWDKCAHIYNKTKKKITISVFKYKVSKYTNQVKVKNDDAHNILTCLLSWTLMIRAQR